MVTHLLPTRQKQGDRYKNPRIPKNNPNGSPDRRFQVSRKLFAFRFFVWVISGFYGVSYFIQLKSAISSSNKRILYFHIVSCLVELAMLFIYTPIDLFQKKLSRGMFPIIIRIVNLGIVIRASIEGKPLTYISTAASTAALVIDFIFIIAAHSYYTKFYKRQFNKLTKDMENFFGEGCVPAKTVKIARLGYFTPLYIPINQINVGSAVSGSVLGGFVLFKGECVYYCDSKEYFERAMKMTVLQAREVSLQTEQQVLKGEDVEEDDIVKPKRCTNECGVSIDVEATDPPRFGEFKPPGGYFLCEGQEQQYVLLEDYRTFDREIASMEQRLEALRAENRVLRDEIKKKKKREKEADEPKDEKLIDDVD